MIKSLLNYFKNSSNLFSLFGNLLFTAFSLVTFLLMVRLLGKEVYGRWVIYMTASSMLDMLRLGLTGTAAIRLISTTQGEDQSKVIAASYHLSLITTFVISVVFLVCYLPVNEFSPSNYYLSVLLFYPFLSFANLPFNQAITLAQGKVDFKQILSIRAVNGVLMFFGISGYLVFVGRNLQHIIIIHIAASALTSLFVVLRKWDGWQYIRCYHKQTLKEILHFGKYSTASYVGSNLLRSSDTIILSLSSVMGAQAVAIYSIPLKFVELAEIPLRSFTATAFPKLSNSFKENSDLFNHTLSLYLVATTLILIPAAILLVIFPELFIKIIAGTAYIDSLPLQKVLVYIIAIYIVLLPLDRYSGVALFAIDKPEINFFKIMLMLAANVSFDLIAVFVFHSLVLVAVATVLFTLLGIWMGWFFIFRETDYSSKTILTSINEIDRIFITAINKFRGRKS